MNKAKAETGSRLILASKSPRRQELLQLCEVPFSIITADIDEESILKAVLGKRRIFR